MSGLYIGLNLGSTSTSIDEFDSDYGGALSFELGYTHLLESGLFIGAELEAIATSSIYEFTDGTFTIGANGLLVDGKLGYAFNDRLSVFAEAGLGVLDASLEADSSTFSETADIESTMGINTEFGLAYRIGDNWEGDLRYRWLRKTRPEDATEHLDFSGIELGFRRYF